MERKNRTLLSMLRTLDEEKKPTVSIWIKSSMLTTQQQVSQQGILLFTYFLGEHFICQSAWSSGWVRKRRESRTKNMPRNGSSRWRRHMTLHLGQSKRRLQEENFTGRKRIMIQEGWAVVWGGIPQAQFDLSVIERLGAIGASLVGHTKAISHCETTNEVRKIKWWSLWWQW